MPTAKLNESRLRQKLTSSRISRRYGKLKMLAEFMLSEANRRPILPPRRYCPKYSEGNRPRKTAKKIEPRKKASMRA